MSTTQQTIARQCQEGAENGTKSFPEILGMLNEAGFDGYFIDYRLGQATYHLRDGGNFTFPMHASDEAIAASFDIEAVRAAIREAQGLVPGYTYRGFCEKVRRAGCAGYLVSLSGRRVVYFGRTAEIHTEHFPT